MLAVESVCVPLTRNTYKTVDSLSTIGLYCVWCAQLVWSSKPIDKHTMRAYSPWQTALLWGTLQLDGNIVRLTTKALSDQLHWDRFTQRQRLDLCICLLDNLTSVFSILYLFAFLSIFDLSLSLSLFVFLTNCYIFLTKHCFLLIF